MLNLNKLFFLLLLFSVSTVHAELMPPTVGTCGFYLQLEQEKQCGDLGYLKNYGFPYCQKFTFQEKNRFTNQGQRFVVKAGLCLQNVLWKNHLSLDDEACSEIKTKAFESHTHCYYHSGFCKLTFHDKMVVFSIVKGELLQSIHRKQALKMLKICRMSR